MTIVLMQGLSVLVNEVNLTGIVNSALLVFGTLLLKAPDYCAERQVRLRGGQRQGTVEICLSRLWGTICDNSWDSHDASVVCRQLGFPSLGEMP